MRSIKVWDLPTRVFHWSLVVSVLVAYVTSSGRPHGFEFLLHVTSGYAVVLLLLFRLFWGLFGGEHARFAAFVRGWPAVKAHLRSLVRLRPEHSLGHNATGGWMVMLLLVTLVLISLTGLLAQGKTGGLGPLTGWLSLPTVRLIGDVHGLLGSFILWLAGIHVLGVLAESVLMRENLVRAMVTGTKPVAAPQARDARAAPRWRAAALVVLLAMLGTYMTSVTSIPDTAPPRIHKERTAED